MRTVQRAMSVLECFTPDRPSLQLRQIAEAIHLSDATTFRLVKALAKLGYLVRGQQQEYSLSLKVLELANRVRATLGMREIAHEIIAKLVKDMGETVALQMRTGEDRVVIDVVGPDVGIMGMVRVGDRAPLIAGAGAKLLLAFQSREEQDQLLPKMIRTYSLDEGKLRRELVAIRKRRYSTSDGEIMQGVFAVAAPIVERDGEVRYALALYGPSPRVRPRRALLIRAVAQASREISQRAGQY
jgi:IclR family KDG regulon transcriptional repressor